MTDETLGNLGKYRVLEEIGRGGFSIVYRAEHPKLKKVVAIKLMLPALFNDTSTIQRFIQEARAVAALKHDNITQVLDLAEEKGRLFMVMEYLPGGDLHNWVEKHGKPNFRRSVEVISAIASALDYAHSQNLIHGDVKPGNILLTEEGAAKLTDFGVLRAVESSGVTSADMTRGTPYYISPEQAEGEHPSPRSDQYALGVVAYELFTGQVPFQGDTPLAIYLKHVREIPRPASQINPLITAQLQEILHKALEKDPQIRYADCRAFARALRDAAAATEAEQYRDLMSRAGAALEAHEPETARPLIEAALQIMPEESKARALLEDLQVRERIQRSYQGAGELLASARRNAQILQTEIENPPDPRGLIAKLAPQKPPRWKAILSELKFGLILALALFLIGLGSGAGRVAYTSMPAGTQYIATLVAGVRTSTLTSTPTATATFTPTPTNTTTSTPTFTPTITPIPAEATDAKGIAMRYMPAGNFTMGGSAEDAYAECEKLNFRESCDKDWFTNEEPAHFLSLDAFEIDKYEVSNAAYRACVDAGECSAPSSISSYTQTNYYGNSSYDDYPVIYVDWYMANTYCSWRDARLPTEAEWEKAARGEDARVYPWGNAFDGNGTNFCDSNCTLDYSNKNYNDGFADTAPVDSFPNGVSSYGVYNMAGNVSEWVSSLYKPYPYDANDGREDMSSEGNRVLRGGSWFNYGVNVHSSVRDRNDPASTYDIFGFRCARSH